MNSMPMILQVLYALQNHAPSSIIWVWAWDLSLILEGGYVVPYVIPYDSFTAKEVFAILI